MMLIMESIKVDKQKAARILSILELHNTGNPADVDENSLFASQWADFLKEQLCNVNPLNEDKAVIPYSQSAATPANSLFLMLYECLLAHQMDKVNSILQAYPMTKENTNIFFHVGLELLKYHGQDKSVEQFCRAILQRPDFLAARKYPVHLAIILSHISQSQLKAAAEWPVPKARTMDEESTNGQMLCEAYQGLAYYGLWALSKLQLEAALLQQMEIGNEEEVSQDIKDKIENAKLDLRAFFTGAGAKWEFLIEHDQQWDMFVHKYIEMIEYNMGEVGVQAAYNKLQAYSEIHKPTLQTSRLLALYDLKQPNPHYQHVEKYCRENLSDNLCLILCNHYIGNHMYKEATSTIFCYLDYIENRDNEDAWDVLIDLVQIPECKPFLKDQWADRKSWWPQYHFVPQRDLHWYNKAVDKASAKQLLRCKSTAGRFFLTNTGDSYVTAMESFIWQNT